MPAEREERRAQLVRRVGDELAAGVVELREALAHAVERARQLAELVGAVVDDGLVEAAARDPVGRPLEPADPAREDAGAAVADEQERDQTSASAPAIRRRRSTRATVASASLERARDEDDVAGSGERPPRRSAVPPRSTMPSLARAADRSTRDGIVRRSSESSPPPASANVASVNGESSTTWR